MGYLWLLLLLLLELLGSNKTSQIITICSYSFHVEHFFLPQTPPSPNVGTRLLSGMEMQNMALLLMMAGWLAMQHMHFQKSEADP